MNISCINFTFCYIATKEDTAMRTENFNTNTLINAINKNIELLYALAEDNSQLMFFNNMIISNCLVYHANAQKALDKKQSHNARKEYQDMKDTVEAIIADAKNSPFVTVQYP